jgi:hypothetical protein
MTPSIGQMRSMAVYWPDILRTHERRKLNATRGHQRFIFGNKVNKQRLSEAGFCDDPLFLWEDVIGISIILWAGRELKPTIQR